MLPYKVLYVKDKAVIKRASFLNQEEAKEYIRTVMTWPDFGWEVRLVDWVTDKVIQTWKVKKATKLLTVREIVKGIKHV